MQVSVSPEQHRAPRSFSVYECSYSPSGSVRRRYVQSCAVVEFQVSLSHSKLHVLPACNGGHPPGQRAYEPVFCSLLPIAFEQWFLQRKFGLSKPFEYTKIHLICVL